MSCSCLPHFCNFGHIRTDKVHPCAYYQPSHVHRVETRAAMHTRTSRNGSHLALRCSLTYTLHRRVIEYTVADEQAPPKKPNLMQTNCSSKRSLQWPVELLSKVPVNGLDRCVLLEGVTAKFATFKVSVQSLMDIEHNIPIPLCFFPPKGTLLFSKLYWLIQT